MSKGFTLSEVLITLGIIGIVAALVIPGIVKGYQRKAMKARFNRAVSVINQAVMRMSNDVGGDLWTYYTGSNKKETELRNHFYSYLNGDREVLERSELNEYFTSLKGSTTTIHYCPAACCRNPALNSFKSTDGIMYSTCLGNNDMGFSFDINGNDKGPNKWGVDLFDFDYTSENKLTNKYTVGYWTPCLTYSKDGSSGVNDGISCTHAAMQDPKYFDKIDF